MMMSLLSQRNPLSQSRSDIQTFLREKIQISHAEEWENLCEITFSCDCDKRQGEDLRLIALHDSLQKRRKSHGGK